MAENSEQRHKEERKILNFVDCSDGNNYDIKEENILPNIQRYSRYDLLSLRNEQISQNHPECALLPDLQVLSIWTCRVRCELQYLGLWKLPNAGNQYITCGSSANCCQLYNCAESQPYASTGGNLGSSNVGFADNQQSQVNTSSSPTLGNKRAIRSRERFLNHQRSINTELITTTSPGEVPLLNSNHQGIKASFVDHRSISSSHLMPAFAKRRMGNVNSLHSSSDSRNNGRTTDQLEMDLSDECERNNHHEISKIRNDVFKEDDPHNHKSFVHNSRINKNVENVDTPKINSDSSISTNKANSVGVNKKTLYERRIGSGRLVPRDVTWDIRSGNGKQNEKNTTTSSTLTEEKDNTSVAENLSQRNSSTTTRFSESRNQERRLYDLRLSNTDDIYKEKHETNSNKRHLANLEDERNNTSTHTNHYQQTPHFMSQRSMSFRRREYDQRDCREYRDQKDARDRREIREQQKGHHRDNKEEPEWFSEGPTSQHDTIELRGFEELDGPELDVKHLTKLKRKSSESLLSQNKTILNTSSNENPEVSSEVSTVTNNTIIMENHNSCRISNKQNKHITDDMANNTNILKPLEIKDNNIEKFGSNVTEMFFDNFLNMEALENSIVCDQNPTAIEGNSSRFSRWFFNNSNNNTSNSEEFVTPIRDEQKSNKDFKECNNCSDSNTFMAFLKCNNLSTPVLPKTVPVNVSALSVEELEARMRKMDSSGDNKMDEQSKCYVTTDSVTQTQAQQQTPDKPLKDVEAFRKILDQLGKPQVDISMKIILPQTGHPISLPTSISVLPSGTITNTLPASSLLKHEYMLKMMHPQQLLPPQHQNLIKVISPQHNRMTQLPSQQKERKPEIMPSTPVSHSTHLMSLVLSQPQKRQDVQHLMQSLARGEVSLNLLEHELNKLNSHNESCNAEFKEESCCVTRSEKTAARTIMSSSQETSSENDITMLAKQNDFLIDSHREDSPLHIPRELQAHTQAIMQNAILKNKLEVEQKEAISRRQEINKQVELEAKSKQQPQMTSNMHQHARHNSPTPLAFTPTSVLRKMTAEKDNNQQIRNQQLSYQHVNQPRMILGGRNNQQILHQQQQVPTSANGISQISTQQKDQIRIQPPAPIKWSSVPHASMNSIHPRMNNANKPMGRPILKGPVPTTSHHIQNQHQQCSSHLSQITSQQNITEMQKYATQQPRQIVGQQFPTHLLQHQMDPTHHNNTQNQQYFQHQRPTIIHCQQIQQTDTVNHTTIPPPVLHPANVNNNSATNLNYQRDGRLSPTSNQLAQWFSPELLAQASAGKLPLLNMNQALSLEEFERSIQHSSTALHN